MTQEPCDKPTARDRFEEKERLNGLHRPSSRSRCSPARFSMLDPRRHRARSVSRQQTTLVAAERTRRVWRGVEIDPPYVDVAVRRWRRLTGDRAIHVSCADFAVFELEETEARHDR
jgi:hypothetical protein